MAPERAGGLQHPSRLGHGRVRLGRSTAAQAVRDGLEDSWEDVLHRTGVERFLLRLRDDEVPAFTGCAARLQRAIGVIYRPETERQSHYFETRLADQFDALIHIDVTHALEPLDKGRSLDHAEAPETFPSAV